MSALIIIAGVVGALFGALILNPLFERDEGRTIFVFVMWLVILGLIVALMEAFR